jgi:hypothetical protein
MVQSFLTLIAGITILYCFYVVPAPSGEPDWCEYMWPPDQSPPSRLNLPEWACQVVKLKKLDEKYTPAIHLNPFFLSGDFDGDNRTDIAILIKNKTSGETGIAIIHWKNRAVFILGAGNPTPNYGSNFDWMDMWSLYPKGKTLKSFHEDYRPTLHGDALHVGKSESATGVIFWNGKKYIWYQETD